MKVFHAFGLYCLGLLASVQANVYNGYKVYELAEAEAATLVAELARNASNYEVFTPMHIMVKPAAQADFVRLLEAHSLDYKLVSGNVGVSVHREFERQRELSKRLPYNGRLGTERYYSFGEINQYLDDLAERYPSRVYLKTVGRSYEGRWLRTIRITNGDGRSDKNVIFMDGGFHAREWISPAAVVYAIGQLVENFGEHEQLLLDYDWVVLPVVNADGYEYTHRSEDTRFWRKTRQPTSESCIGIDPNRNFDFHWNEDGASSDPCAQTYAGSRPFAAPEALVVRDLLHSLAGRGKMYLTVHSYGSLILYPWGWTSELPDTVDDLHEVAAAGYEAILEATGTVYRIGSSTNVLYVAAGASDDYAFNAGFPISFTMELPAGGTGFDPPPTQIDALVKETWVGIVAMARKVVEKYPLV